MHERMNTNRLRPRKGNSYANKETSTKDEEAFNTQIFGERDKETDTMERQYHKLLDNPTDKYKYKTYRITTDSTTMINTSLRRTKIGAMEMNIFFRILS